jgi:anti-sigma regulatory factor (Ser/Thr protein kinase)
MAGNPRAGVSDRRGHVVKIYDDDRDLIDDVSEFIADGITAGDHVIVVATPARRHALEQLPGVDVTAARATGQYVALDAGEMLRALVVDGEPDRNRFRAVMSELIEGAAPRPVRIFGEMVSLLWDGGNVDAALRLEGLWNDLAGDHELTLLCAYARSSFGDPAALGAIRRVCDHHGAIVTPRSYESNAPSTCPPAEPASASEQFLPVPLAIRAARRFVDRTLTGWGEPDVREDAAIVVSELATNAVRHAVSPFRVTVSRRGGTVRISVRDAGSGLPEIRRPAAETTNGRGLALVAALCSSWGVDRASDGKVVWADVAA